MALGGPRTLTLPVPEPPFGVAIHDCPALRILALPYHPGVLAGARTLAFPEVFEGQLYWGRDAGEKGRHGPKPFLAAGGPVPAPFRALSGARYGAGPMRWSGGALREHQDQRLYAQPLTGSDAGLTPDDGSR